MVFVWRNFPSIIIVSRIYRLEKKYALGGDTPPEFNSSPLKMDG